MKALILGDHVSTLIVAQHQTILEEGGFYEEGPDIAEKAAELATSVSTKVSSFSSSVKSWWSKMPTAI